MRQKNGMLWTLACLSMLIMDTGNQSAITYHLYLILFMDENSFHKRLCAWNCRYCHCARSGKKQQREKRYCSACHTNDTVLDSDLLALFLLLAAEIKTVRNYFPYRPNAAGMAVAKVGVGDQMQPRWFLCVAGRLNVRLQAHVACCWRRRVLSYLAIFHLFNDKQNTFYDAFFCA